MIIMAGRSHVNEMILEKVKKEDITCLRIDRYDGYLFDDFEISKYWAFSAQYEVADDFYDEISIHCEDFNFCLFFTNDYNTLFCRFYNTLEQIFEEPENINRVSREYIEEALKKSLITFKQYNAYMKNHGGAIM